MTNSIAAAILALAVSSTRFTNTANAFVHPPPSLSQHAQTQLNMWNPFATAKESGTDDSKSLKDPNTMKMRELKEELESYGGVESTRGLFEKKELIDSLEAARQEYFLELEGESVNEPGGPDPWDQPAAAASSSPTPDRNMATRYDKIQAEMERCKKMKTADLRKELEEYGIDGKGMFEKSDYARAVAEARVDGMKKQYKKSSSSTRKTSTGFGRNYESKEKGAAEPYDPTYRNVVTRKLEDGAKAGFLLSGSVIDVNARSDFQ